jgi:hypothetical protein
MPILFLIQQLDILQLRTSLNQKLWQLVRQTVTFTSVQKRNRCRLRLKSEVAARTGRQLQLDNPK